MIITLFLSLFYVAIGQTVPVSTPALNGTALPIIPSSFKIHPFEGPREPYNVGATFRISLLLVTNAWVHEEAYRVPPQTTVSDSDVGLEAAVWILEAFVEEWSTDRTIAWVAGRFIEYQFNTLDNYAQDLPFPSNGFDIRSPPDRPIGLFHLRPTLQSQAQQASIFARSAQLLNISEQSNPIDPPDYDVSLQSRPGVTASTRGIIGLFAEYLYKVVIPLDPQYLLELLDRRGHIYLSEPLLGVQLKVTYNQARAAGRRNRVLDIANSLSLIMLRLTNMETWRPFTASVKINRDSRVSMTFEILEASGLGFGANETTSARFVS